jgi:hypothetical protein
MPKEHIKYRWASISQLRALPKLPITIGDEMTPCEFTERLKRREHKIKIARTKEKYSHA